MPFSIGQQVGPYQIMEQLGQGGMAIVYKAYHAALDRYVAIKVLHSVFLEDPSFQARFQREARLVAKLEHPNIVPVYDYAEQDRQPYLVMKFIEGETLKARLQRNPLSSADVIRIVNSVGSALSYAHHQGILHRDVKPSNVILANDGQIYLADFGLARMAQSVEMTFSSDMVIGTPQYISPEQAMGTKDLDEGTDIYSFGVMLYEITVGQVPFSADTPFSIIHDHIYSSLPLPSHVNPRISPDLERVLLKALSKTRADRFADIAGLVVAFKQAWTASASPLVATIPSSPFGPAFQAGPSAPPVMRADPDAATPPPLAPLPPVGQPQRPKSLFRWVWVVALLLLCVCCLVALFELRNRSNPEAPLQTLSPQAGITTSAYGVTSAASTVEPNNGSPIPIPANLTGVPALDLPLISLEKAKQQVEQTPNNSKLRMIYAYALIKAGQAETGYEQIKKGATLAGRNEILLLGAAKAFKEQNIWLGAAILYLQLIQHARVIPAPLVDDVHEAVYRGFAENNAPEVLDYGTIGRIDRSLGLVAQARYTLVNRNDDAVVQTLIDQLDALQPGLLETRLLQAELLIKQEKNTEAKTVLLNLSGTEGIPEWIYAETDRLLSTIK